MIKLPKSQYEPILKEDLQCWRCEEAAKNFPALKEHLKEHFDSDCAKSAAKQEREERRKQKRAHDELAEGEQLEPEKKKINLEQ
jgi:aprataxin